jgi:RHS repeat-associated protein
LSGSFARINLPEPVTSATYDEANELMQWGTMVLTYDANGNLATDGLNTYSWDARNQLSSFNAAGFQYDAFGRRTLNASGTSFLFDGVNSVQELISASPVANILTAGIDEVLLRTDMSGNWNLLSSAPGSTLALADNMGILQTQYTYEPFGNSSIVAGSNPTQYAGRENDGNGLYYYRARYYAPGLGRFISEDPIGIAGGLNVYRYSSDNPINNIDPFGLYDVWDFAKDFGSFSEAFADTFTFGSASRLNNAVGADRAVDRCSWVHTAGTVAGIASGIVIGGAVGADAAEARAGEEGYEFSHAIPKRYGGPRSIWNGNYVSEEFHYLTDPFRYPSGWQAFGPKLPAIVQQLLRIPWVYVGGAAGGAYTGAGAASSATAGRKNECK